MSKMSMAERRKENRMMTIASIFGLIVMIVARIDMWSGSTTFDRVLITTGVITLSLFLLYLCYERHWIITKEKLDAEHKVD